MNNPFCRSILALGMLFLFLSSNAKAVGLEVAVGGWNQDPEGLLSYKGNSPVNVIDLVNEAGYTDENRFIGRAKIDLPVVPNVYLMATPMEFEGNGIKATSFKFGDINFNASAPFYSRVKLNHYDLGLYYGIPLMKTATLNTFNLELGVNFRILDVEAQVSQSGVGTESADETLVAPMIYFGFQFMPIDELSLEAELRGIAYSDNHYYDFIGRFKYGLPGPVFLAAGWRLQDFEIDEEDIRATLEFSGPFAEAGFDF